MAQVHKKLGQVKPSAATNTKAYEVPAGDTAGDVSAIVTSIVASNNGGSDDTIRIFSVTAGDTAGVGNDLYYGVTVPTGDCFLSNPATVLRSAGAIWVYATNGTVTFTVSGLEIS